MSYRVELTQEALLAYTHIRSKKLARRVDEVFDLLQQFPWIGKEYEPLYPVNQVPFDLRVISADRYGIFYVVDESSETVIIYFIEDWRRNPKDRFLPIENLYT